MPCNATGVVSLLLPLLLQESVRRQLKRGLELAKMNRMVTDTGIGLMSELRATDTSEDAARKRYRCAVPATCRPLDAPIHTQPPVAIPLTSMRDSLCSFGLQRL